MSRLRAVSGFREGRFSVNTTGRIQLVVATVLVFVEVVAVRAGRPSLPREARLSFWEGVRSGLPAWEAGVAAGVGKSSAEVWFRGAGGLVASGPGPVIGRYLSGAEREEIAVGVAAGEPLRVI